jgi:hypothetical protein
MLLVMRQVVPVRRTALSVSSLFALCCLSLPGCATTAKTAPQEAAQPIRDDGRCNRAGKRVEELDINGDGKTDVWKMYTTTIEAGTQVSVLTCREVDVNFDGRKDMWVHFDSAGNKALEEFDLDFDGHIDLWVIYQNGKKIREEMDTSFDGRPDLFKFYENEKLVRIERSSKQNGKIDTWEYYEGGKLDRIGYDTLGTGKPDRWDRSPDDSMPAEATAQAQAPAAPRAPAALPRMDSAPDKSGGDKPPGAPDKVDKSGNK